MSCCQFCQSHGALVHVSAIFGFRRFFAPEKIQIGEDRLKFRFLQRTAANTHGSCSVYFVQGQQNRRPAAVAIGTMPMLTSSLCHKNLLLIKTSLTVVVCRGRRRTVLYRNDLRNAIVKVVQKKNSQRKGQCRSDSGNSNDPAMPHHFGTRRPFFQSFRFRVICAKNDAAHEYGSCMANQKDGRLGR